MGHHVPLQHGRGAEDLPTCGAGVVLLGMHLVDMLPVILQCGEAHLAFLAVIRIFYVCVQAGHPWEGGQRETTAQAAVSDVPLPRTARWKAVQPSCGARVQGLQVSVAARWLYSLPPRMRDSSRPLDSPPVQCQTAHLHHLLPAYMSTPLHPGSTLQGVPCFFLLSAATGLPSTSWQTSPTHL